jgi:hypothetical protein
MRFGDIQGWYCILDSIILFKLIIINLSWILMFNDESGWGEAMDAEWALEHIIYSL